ncbi:MAG: four helix bundle protein [Chlamydiae bacterium]|nr:four helix bundle protein [Chlamydiota bacterium]MBI3277966.1 four helix bundle protein [Chlamydiota bacterium]
MTFERFEDVPVWKEGVKLTTAIFQLTEDKRFRFKGDIANQIQRASLSIPNNIAEGFERGTTQELITFLYYARGSAGEVRSILAVMEQMRVFDDLKFQISNLKLLVESISRQVRGWTNTLQNTKIQGQRHLNDNTKKAFEREKNRKEFEATLKKYWQPS